MSGNVVLAADTIMVVENDVLVRTEVASYLRRCGYRVIEAAGSAEAVVLLEQREIQIDIVLTAVEIGGGMNGFALRRWVGEQRPEIEVILVGTPARAVDAAADLCESGPAPRNRYDPQTILDQIKRAVAGRSASRKSA